MTYQPELPACGARLHGDVAPPTPMQGKGSNMKNFLLFMVFVGCLGGAARAGVVLDTSNPPGTPLNMQAGTTSGPMFAGVISNNAPNDVMTAWQFVLAIAPEAGASGTLTFEDPATTTPSNPPNYVFGANGLGISASNGGSNLSGE